MQVTGQLSDEVYIVRAKAGRRHVRKSLKQHISTYSNLSLHYATFRMFRSCAWRYCSISRNVWGSFCLGKDWWCGEYQSKQDGWLARGERQILKEYSIIRNMRDSTTRLKFTLYIIGASLTLMQASARDMQLLLAQYGYLQNAGISMYFTSQHVSASLPERTAVQQWNLQLLWAWRSSCLGELTCADQTMAILRESPTLRDLGLMDEYDLVFVYVDFITGLGMMAQNIATRRSRSNSQTHRLSLFCLMGNMGPHDRSDSMALPLGCCLGVVRWILKIVTIVSHTHTITRTPAIPAQMPRCSLSRCLTCS